MMNKRMLNLTQWVALFTITFMPTTDDNGGDRQRDCSDHRQPFGRDGHLGVRSRPVELRDAHQEFSWLWLIEATRSYWSSRSFIFSSSCRGER